MEPLAPAADFNDTRYRKELLTFGYIRKGFRSHVTCDIVTICLNYYDEDPESIYKLLHALQHGTVCTYYKAIHKYTGDRVVFKIIDTEEDEHHEQQQAVREYINRLKSSSSSYIVGYLDDFIKDESIWIVMQYLPVSIGDVLNIIKQTLTEPQIQIIMRESLKGLQYLDENKIDCDNIRASKIYIDHNGYCKLGNIKMDLKAWTDINVLFGGAYWLAPETIVDDKMDIKSVIWSLGITAIEMATGKPPNADKNPIQALLQIPRAASPNLSLDGDWSDEFREFVRICTMKKAVDRPNINELLKHKWIKGADDMSLLSDLAQNVMPLLEDMKNVEVMDNEERENDDWNYGDNDSEDANYETMILDGNDDDVLLMESDSDTEEEDHDGYGTMIMNEHSAILREHNDENKNDLSYKQEIVDYKQDIDGDDKGYDLINTEPKYTSSTKRLNNRIRKIKRKQPKGIWQTIWSLFAPPNVICTCSDK